MTEKEWETGFQAIRQQTLELEMFLKMRREVRNAPVLYLRQWGLLTIARGSLLHDFYRALALDMDGDLEASAKAIATFPNKPMARDWLKSIRRFSYRHYSYRLAGVVNGLLDGHEQSRLWRIWGRKDWLNLRLGVGVGAGFLLLGASSSLTDYLSAAHNTAMAWWVGIPALTAVLLMSLQEVQSVVGRVPDLWSRTWCLFLRGIGYGLAGAATAKWLNSGLERKPPLGPPAEWTFYLLCGCVAMLLGFVFQLFGLDRSIGEPVG